MQAPDDGEGGAGTPSGQHSSQLPDCHSSSGSPEGEGGPGNEGAVIKAALATPRPDQAPPAQGPGGDAVRMAVGPGSGPLEFTLTVTLRSPLEADMARRSLIPDAQRHQHGIQREFTVNGSALAIWTAADLALFRSSINSSLDQLCLVIRNIRRFVPPPAKSLREERGLRPNFVSPTRQCIGNSNLE
ncbi:EKC/KEOPS complex subunit LAGE3-like isoform X2 [Sus scrofa]|uniref:EKC/KEOPS complex subunit LAGE3-like isoform X2 n=1 Tax=Sus scrofa TaxID=9823 RepID=UPI0003AEC08E|nr:EKC/KEOPS complex subunit LAGE3-like isoform X2 [Sus scrofa]